MQEHAKRIKRIQSLCDELDEAIRTSKDLHVTARQLQAEATALTDELISSQPMQKVKRTKPRNGG